MRRRLLGTSRRVREHEHRLERLLAIGNDFTWEMDPKGYVKHLSPSFETHTSRRIEEFMRAGLPGGPEIVHDAEWKLLLKEYPQLVRRPVVVTDDGVVTQGFSDNAFKKRFQENLA